MDKCHANVKNQLSLKEHLEYRLGSQFILPQIRCEFVNNCLSCLAAF